MEAAAQQLGDHQRRLFEIQNDTPPIQLKSMLQPPATEIDVAVNLMFDRIKDHCLTDRSAKDQRLDAPVPIATKHDQFMILTRDRG